MKGIMFKEDLFHKVVEGVKTETRRVLSDKWIINEEPDRYKGGFIDLEEGGLLFIDKKPEITPYMSPIPLVNNEEDNLYLKEPFHITKEGELIYKFSLPLYEREKYKWENKLFMPEKYARYFIKITKVTCEQLQEITRSSIREEGLIVPQKYCSDELEYNYRNWLIDNWIKLWDSIEKKYTWDYNPWVWVYKFELVECQDFMSEGKRKTIEILEEVKNTLTDIIAAEESDQIGEVSILNDQQRVKDINKALRWVKGCKS